MLGSLRAGAGDEWNGRERHLRQILSFILLQKFYYPPKSYALEFLTFQRNLFFINPKFRQGF